MATCDFKWMSILKGSILQTCGMFGGFTLFVGSCLRCGRPSALTAWTGCCSPLSQKTWSSKCPKLPRAASGETPHICMSIWRWVESCGAVQSEYSSKLSPFRGLIIHPCNRAWFYHVWGFYWTLGFRPKPARSVDWQWPSIRLMRKPQRYPGAPLSRTCKALSKSTAALAVN